MLPMVPIRSARPVMAEEDYDLDDEDDAHWQQVQSMMPMCLPCREDQHISNDAEDQQTSAK